MIKNVIVVNDYDYVQGGASLVAIEQANLLYEAGYNVIFFCAVSNKEKSILNEKIKVVNTNLFDSLTNPNKIKGLIQGINNKKAYFLMNNLLKLYPSDETIVSIHGYTKALSVSFIRACKKNNVKTILTAHDYFSICPNGGLFNYKKNRVCSLQGKVICKFCNCDSRNYLFKMYRNIRFFKQDKIFKFRKRINYLITISETNEKILKRFFENSEIVRIYNPTSINNKMSRISVLDNNYYVYIGRVDKEKGLDLVCKQFKKTNDQLIIVGSGNMLEELKSEFSSKQIEFTGWLSHDKVIEKMRLAKGLIFSSLVYEGAPLTVFESQSIGLPCFISKFSNGIDFITNDDGIIYNPYDDSLSKTINSITNEEIDRLSINSYKKYWDFPFDKSGYIKKIIELFQKV